MTAVQSPFSPLRPPAPLPPVTSAAAPSSWQKWDATLDWLSEQLNPIVVKEARQALKSKQFTITFGLLLVFGACWTALGVSLQMPAVFHSPSGPFMVVGYYIILAVPLIVIVPFAAFRSLAAEREDGTFDLLSIATLTARQVVVGKLASAMLQMIVYYSAIAPCIAFTYLLRGLDIITIGLMLAYLFLASTLLSALGLALATVTKERHWQVLLSVVLVAGLVIVFWIWLMSMMGLFEMFLNYAPFDDPHFWMANVAVLMFHGSFMALFVLVSAGQISFATDNRSTPVRWVVFAQHALIFGWSLYIVFLEPTAGFVLGSTAGLIYWWIVGSFLIGERADLSSRVRRQLPQTFMGRTLLTWFNPGSGTGYVFTLTNLGLLLIALYGAAALPSWIAAFLGVFEGYLPQRTVIVLRGWSTLTLTGPFTLDQMCQFAAAAWFFAAAYLGVGRLMVLLVRNRVPSGVVFSFLLQIVLVTFGTLIPLVVQLSLFSTHDFNFSSLQTSNPFWTLPQMLFNSSGPFSYADTTTSFVILLIGGCGMAVLHFVLAIPEIEQTRLVAPQRVLEEDAAALAARTPVKRKNPWDEPAATHPQ
jgi:ABC-type transport system involved in cytochrome c biogenesis permease component